MSITGRRSTARRSSPGQADEAAEHGRHHHSHNRSLSRLAGIGAIATASLGDHSGMSAACIMCFARLRPHRRCPTSRTHLAACPLVLPAAGPCAANRPRSQYLVALPPAARLEIVAQIDPGQVFAVYIVRGAGSGQRANRFRDPRGICCRRDRFSIFRAATSSDSTSSGNGGTSGSVFADLNQASIRWAAASGDSSAVGSSSVSGSSSSSPLRRQCGAQSRFWLVVHPSASRRPIRQQLRLFAIQLVGTTWPDPTSIHLPHRQTRLPSRKNQPPFVFWLSSACEPESTISSARTSRSFASLS